MLLEVDVHANEDCAGGLDLAIKGTTTSHTWEKNHKSNLAEYLVTATERRGVAVKH